MSERKSYRGERVNDELLCLPVFDWEVLFSIKLLSARKIYKEEKKWQRLN